MILHYKFSVSPAVMEKTDVFLWLLIRKSRKIKPKLLI